mmetsp:Transcript_40212/g.61374  ORF Transcript_40212/g.61374 Transcript_40212/m.61374 type:complete len:317 (-) Transcript_40212:504-1454(-)
MGLVEAGIRLLFLHVGVLRDDFLQAVLEHSQVSGTAVVRPVLELRGNHVLLPLLTGSFGQSHEVLPHNGFKINFFRPAEVDLGVSPVIRFEVRTQGQEVGFLQLLNAHVLNFADIQLRGLGNVLTSISLRSRLLAATSLLSGLLVFRKISFTVDWRDSLFVLKDLFQGLRLSADEVDGELELAVVLHGLVEDLHPELTNGFVLLVGLLRSLNDSRVNSESVEGRQADLSHQEDAGEGVNEGVHEQNRTDHVVNSSAGSSYQGHRLVGEVLEVGVRLGAVDTVNVKWELLHKELRDLSDFLTHGHTHHFFRRVDLSD